MAIPVSSYSLVAIPELSRPPGAVYSRASSAYRMRRNRFLEAVTNGVIRSDYHPTTGDFLGWLLTGTVTNLLKSSEDFRSAANGNPVTAWGNTNITVTADAVTSPDGNNTADLITHTADGSALAQTVSGFTAGDKITVSLHAKKGNVNFLRIELGNSVSCWYDLNTGAVGSNGAGSGNVTFSSKGLEVLENGFVRVFLTVNTSSITTLACNVFATASDGGSSVNGNTAYLWGAMANIGEQAPYVKSDASATSHSADVMTVGSSWWNTLGGNTVFYRFRTPARLAGTQTIWSLDDGTANESIVLYLSSGIMYLGVTDGGALQTAPLNLGAVSALTEYKVACSMDTNDIAAAVNGGTVITDTTATLPAVTTFRFGMDYANGNPAQAHFRHMAAFPEAISDTDLRRITA
jgi:hypothetical protein